MSYGWHRWRGARHYMKCGDLAASVALSSMRGSCFALYLRRKAGAGSIAYETCRHRSALVVAHGGAAKMYRAICRRRLASGTAGSLYVCRGGRGILARGGVA